MRDCLRLVELKNIHLQLPSPDEGLVYCHIIIILQRLVVSNYRNYLKGVRSTIFAATAAQEVQL